MKLNLAAPETAKPQLELNIPAPARRQRRRAARAEQARWWFARMREVVRTTPLWEEAAGPRPWREALEGRPSGAGLSA